MSKELQTRCWQKLIDDISFLVPPDDSAQPNEEDDDDSDSLFKLIPESLLPVRRSISEEKKMSMMRALNELHKRWTAFGREIREKQQSALDFWRTAPSLIVNLQPLAQMLLSIPASSAASESAASVMGRIKSTIRSSLLPKHTIAEATISMNQGLFGSEDEMVEKSVQLLLTRSRVQEPAALDFSSEEEDLSPISEEESVI